MTGQGQPNLGADAISLREAAEMIGVSRSTAYSLADRGEFPVPVFRIGSQMRVSRRRLAEWIDSDHEQAS